MRKNGTNELIGDGTTSAKLALYKHHVINGTVPKTIPAWAKKKAIPKVRTFATGVFYPAWTYKKELKVSPAHIPGLAFDGASTEKYVIEFDRLNGFIN